MKSALWILTGCSLPVYSPSSMASTCIDVLEDIFHLGYVLFSFVLEYYTEGAVIFLTTGGWWISGGGKIIGPQWGDNDFGVLSIM